MSGVTVRIKSIVRAIVSGSSDLSVFTADDLSIKAQIVSGDLDQYYFKEVYKTRPRYSKGTTVVEYTMKGLEMQGIVSRIAPRTWIKTSSRTGTQSLP